MLVILVPDHYGWIGLIFKVEKAYGSSLHFWLVILHGICNAYVLFDTSFWFYFVYGDFDLKCQAMLSFHFNFLIKIYATSISDLQQKHCINEKSLGYLVV